MMSDEEIQKWAEWFDDNDDSGMKANSKDFLAAKDKYAYLEEHKNDIRSVPNALEIKNPSLEKAIKTLKEEYTSPDEIPMAYLRKIASDNKTSVEAIKQAFETENSKERATQKIEAEDEGRQRRKKEIDEMPLYKKMFMSDASQQRYIEDPNSSMFGKEGSFNPLSTEGQNEIRDVILSGTGVVGDLIPGFGGALVGPAVRAGRDVFGGSDKSIKDIAKDFGKDVAAGAIIEGTPTWLRQTKVGKSIMSKIPKMEDTFRNIENANKSKETAVAVSEGLKKLGKEDVENLSQKEAQKLVNNLPDSPMKADLQSTVGVTKDYNPAELAQKTQAWSVTQRNAPLIDFYETTGSAFNRAIEGASNEANKYRKLLSDMPKLSKGEKAIDTGLKSFGTVARNINQRSADDNKKPEVKTKKEEQLRKLGLAKDSKKNEYNEYLDDIIATTSNQWEGGFTPRAIPGDPMYEAYLKWKRESEE